MVKMEMESSAEESGSESSFLQTPLAASKQKSAPSEEDSGEDDDQTSGDDVPDDKSENYQPTSQEMAPATPRSVNDTLKNFLNKFPHVRLRNEKYSADLDLTDPDDEIWIVRCPAAIDAKKVLTNSKLDACQVGEASKIHSLQTDKRLEGFVVENTAQKPVTILAGKNFKSFVPKGTIQIRETCDDFSDSPMVKQEGYKGSEDSVPFPEEIRERHPLLGVDYKSALKLPKRTKKALSLAAQRADAWYLQNGTEQIAETVSKKSHSIKTKRKRKLSELPINCSTDEMIKMLIKEEPGVSPRNKKHKKEAVAEEDDLSWLQNI
ncbi:uncharacterized protein LOC129768422 [Toxorhynchites rutilus septentrionalis]|uniref:uncharacterized protein LOC129768422 n=1 Tax=Toxorhynchites rutilus septentrionalis TaxID=329112 RepID=UPI00247883E7|nr:uncharacterized protein LOC129768422 [Toxorhynchites rutilus septentrionalis]